ncbi:hypothetical protein PG985_005347 [Apiospora marii]|uniref:GXWXG domain-containing protein n=1 Tax=Apiospora marii TaxID=335849 RepID=A0ABR1SBP4_9PEZI
MLSFQDAVAAGKVTTAQAHEIFDTLPAVQIDELRGLWKGAEFPTASPSDGLLAASGWFGKRFTGNDHVDPLVWYGSKSQKEDRISGDSSELFAADPPKAMSLIFQ